jgi:hypothetical protein
MALSAKFSPRSDTLSDKEREQLTYARGKFDRFRDWFVAEFGSVACRDVQLKVLGRVFKITDDHEFQEFMEYQKQSGKYCREVYLKTALKVSEVILAEK